LSSAFEVKERKRAEEIIEDEIKRLEKYHMKGDWEKFFDEDALDLILMVSPDKKEILGFSVLLAMGGPTIEFLCHRGSGEIIYTSEGGEVRRDVPYEICDDIISYLEEVTA
jgi:hypothetical protein